MKISILNSWIDKLEYRFGPLFEIKYKIYKFFYEFPGRWWLSHRIIPRHRYHIVNTGLSPNYYDPDQRMLHSVMSIFCDWYENSHHCIRVEDFEDRTDEDSQMYLETNREAFETYKRIYDWWTKEVQKDECEWINKKCYKDGEYDNDIEEKMEQEITDNLIQLMKYRLHFWF